MGSGAAAERRPGPSPRDLGLPHRLLGFTDLAANLAAPGGSSGDPCPPKNLPSSLAGLVIRKVPQALRSLLFGVFSHSAVVQKYVVSWHAIVIGLLYTVVI